MRIRSNSCMTIVLFLASALAGEAQWAMPTDAPYMFTAGHLNDDNLLDFLSQGDTVVQVLDTATCQVSNVLVVPN